MRNTVIWISLMLVVPHTAIAAPPKELYGKSVTVSWGETREQKWPGETNWHQVTRAGQLIVYVSSAGRAFNRMTFSGSGPGGRKGSGNSDQVAGAGGDKYENRALNFQSRSLSMITPMSGGARSVNITFSEGFAGCSASVLTGKSGTGKIVMRSLLHQGQEFEIRSVQSGAASCSISNGNLFGG